MGCESRSFYGLLQIDFLLIHEDDWTFTGMDTKNDSPTFYCWGLKSIHNMHTSFTILASNGNVS